MTTELPEPAATIVRLTEKLREDLAFAAPELWALHIEKRLAQAYEAGVAANDAEDDAIVTAGLARIGNRPLSSFTPLDTFLDELDSEDPAR